MFKMLLELLIRSRAIAKILFAEGILKESIYFAIIFKIVWSGMQWAVIKANLHCIWNIIAK